jgi:ankyrin repeat protein
MILDHHQFAYRLLNIIRSNGDIFHIKKLLRNISQLNLNYLNYDGQSLVHLCCLYNRLDLLKLFVEYCHCDIFHNNDDGWLPLHIAVYLGYIDIVDYLIQSMKSKH